MNHSWAVTIWNYLLATPAGFSPKKLDLPYIPCQFLRTCRMITGRDIRNDCVRKLWRNAAAYPQQQAHTDDGGLLPPPPQFLPQFFF
jgi:hypothetical protein